MGYKKILSFVLTFCLLLGTVFSCNAVDSALRTVPENVRKRDGFFETMGTVLGFFDMRMIYPKCQKVAPIAELSGHYVPQGFCYIDTENLFAVTYYNENAQSILVLTDAQTGERVRTVNLCYEDGSPCNAHCGGVTDVGDSLLISSGKSLRRLKIADALQGADYGEVRFCGTLKTHMQASFAGSYGSLLFVGQYYTYKAAGSYDTPPEQRLYAPDGSRNYAMCEVFDIPDVDAFFQGSKKPVAAVSIPNKVQGLTFDGKQIILSTSAGIFGSSKLSYYDFDMDKPDGTFTLDGDNLPLYFITRKSCTKSVAMPPMLEGIDRFDGQVAGIFESCADKFIGVRLRMPFVCTLGSCN